jgi:subfamily B ATP-binding cassette protein MsbA
MRIYLRLLRFLKPHMHKFVVAFISLILFSLLSGVTLGLISPLLRVLFGLEENLPLGGEGIISQLKALVARHILQYPPIEATTRIALLMVLLFFLKSLFLYLSRVFSTMVQEGTTRDIRNRLFSTVLEMPLGYFHGTSTGEILSKFINDVGMVRGALTDGVYVLLRESLIGISYLTVAFLASWKLTLFSLLLVPASGILIGSMGKKLRKRSTRAQERMGQIGRHLSETLGGIKIVKGFTAEKREKRRFSKKTQEYYRAYLRFELLGSLGPPLTEFLSAIVAAVILVFGARLIFVEHSLSPDRFFVFLAAALSLLQPLKRITQANVYVQHGIAAGKRIFDILDRIPKGKRVSGEEFPGLKRSVVFDEVYFSYIPGRYVLKDINLEILKGEKVALVGPSGAGKSTLADLLAYFYTPTAGKIFIDGKDLSQYDPVSYRSHIAIVPQDPFLFSGTIYDNIAYAKPDASFDEVIRAAKMSAAHEFIEKLPEGYNTVVGERGTTLSGGERQRIALARAILRNPDILILDEATSNLDSESERLIKRALNRILEGRTTLIIAHRLTTVLEADKIVVIDNGRIVDVGKHEELIERCGLYRKLYSLQFTDSLKEN